MRQSTPVHMNGFRIQNPLIFFTRCRAEIRSYERILTKKCIYRQMQRKSVDVHGCKNLFQYIPLIKRNVKKNPNLSKSAEPFLENKPVPFNRANFHEYFAGNPFIGIIIMITGSYEDTHGIFLCVFCFGYGRIGHLITRATIFW